MKFRSVPQCGEAGAPSVRRSRAFPWPSVRSCRPSCWRRAPAPEASRADSGGGAGGSGGGVDTPRVTVAMVTHEAPGDTFWDLIRKGAQAAADKDNIELKYSNNKEGPEQGNLIQNAVDSKVAGIATTMATPDALKPSLANAVAAGIPVVAFNSGIDQWKELGALEYFGQDEKLAGESAGKRLAAEGAKNVICVIQEQGSVALEARCAGIK